MSQHGRESSQAPTLMERLRVLFGLQGGSLREDIEDAIEGNGTSDVFTAQERTLLRNVLDLHEVRIEDIMVPRADIIAVALTDSLGAVLARFREAGHSRLPVHGETLDEPKGMVHIRDFVHHITEPRGGEQDEGGALQVDFNQTLEASGVMRSVLFVPLSMQALDLLVRMQATRTHMAIVIDEFGGTDGLVTIEDIVEMIVGDIEDEHDEDESPKIIEEGHETWLVDARASLEDLSHKVGRAVASPEEADEVDTLGGLVTSLAGHVPAQGERIRGAAGVEFEIVDADQRRVKTVRIRPATDPTQTAGDASTTGADLPAATDARLA